MRLKWILTLSLASVLLGCGASGGQLAETVLKQATEKAAAESKAVFLLFDSPG